MFEVGNAVQRRSDRTQIGTIVRVQGTYGDEAWYVIDVQGAEQIVPERDLVQHQRGRTPKELLTSKAFGDREDLLRLLTFHKLTSPVDNTLYSLHGSRTEFYPHQYKPLLKFLGSERQKLLIADEVGLGKTIEAGLIMIEQRQRSQLDQVMVACPAALCPKWREELWRRFDEEFEVINAGSFRRLLDDLVTREELGKLRLIISLESLRQRKHLELLEAVRPHFDLFVVDEAHHLRNRETLSHRVCALLAEAASSVLLLTATPIQLGEENLFNLFRVLDPAEFNDLDVFQKRLEANAPIVESQRLARRGSRLPSQEILERLESVGRGGAARFFGENPLYNRVVSELRESPPSDPFAIAQLQADLDELNLLGDVFTRSKKRDVQTKAPTRSPLVVRPEMSLQEAEFYGAVTDFVRGHTGPGVIGGFAVMAAQRQAASCIPAAKDRYLGKANEALAAAAGPEEHDLEELYGDSVEDDVARGRATSAPEPLVRRVRKASAGLGSVDTKYEALKEVLGRLEEAEPGRKILLFAYYKGTLRYLHRRLMADGYECEIIHGDIPSDPINPDQDERGQRMRRFREDPSVKIMLSSEVGSEGLDFQFCHILVNYDLPWNPMRVEQRIGRLDRLGQKSDRIVIVNFSVPGTIEDKVLYRLYERIGIFERSIGDLEAILGDEIHKLQIDLLTQELTPEEQERRVEQAAKAVENKKAQIERLEAESAKFVGVEGHLEQELERIRRGGELLSADDREAFFRKFLEQKHPRSKLTPSRAAGVFRLVVTDDIETEIRSLPDTVGKLRFLRQVRDEGVLVTFSSQVAYERDTVEFLGPQHPLMHLAVDHFEQDEEQLHPVAALVLDQSETAPAGQYIFAVFTVDIQTGRKRKRIETVFARIEDGQALPLPDFEAGLLLGEVARSATPGPISWDPRESDLSDWLERAQHEFMLRLAARTEDLQERNEARVQTRLASLTASHESAIAKQQGLLDRARELNREPRYVRMLEGTIRNMELRYKTRRERVEGERHVSFSAQLIGCGILEIGAAS